MGGLNELFRDLSPFQECNCDRVEVLRQFLRIVKGACSISQQFSQRGYINKYIYQIFNQNQAIINLISRIQIDSSILQQIQFIIQQILEELFQMKSLEQMRKNMRTKKKEQQRVQSNHEPGNQDVLSNANKKQVNAREVSGKAKQRKLSRQSKQIRTQQNTQNNNSIDSLRMALRNRKIKGNEDHENSQQGQNQITKQKKESQKAERNKDANTQTLRMKLRNHKNKDSQHHNQMQQIKRKETKQFKFAEDNYKTQQTQQKSLSKLNNVEGNPKQYQVADSNQLQRDKVQSQNKKRLIQMQKIRIKLKQKKQVKKQQIAPQSNSKQYSEPKNENLSQMQRMRQKLREEKQAKQRKIVQQRVQKGSLNEELDQIALNERTPKQKTDAQKQVISKLQQKMNLIEMSQDSKISKLQQLRRNLKKKKSQPNQSQQSIKANIQQRRQNIRAYQYQSDMFLPEKIANQNRNEGNIMDLQDIGKYLQFGNWDEQLVKQRQIQMLPVEQQVQQKNVQMQEAQQNELDGVQSQYQLSDRLLQNELNQKYWLENEKNQGNNSSKQQRQEQYQSSMQVQNPSKQDENGMVQNRKDQQLRYYGQSKGKKTYTRKQNKQFEAESQKSFDFSQQLQIYTKKDRKNRKSFIKDSIRLQALIAQIDHLMHPIESFSNLVAQQRSQEQQSAEQVAFNSWIFQPIDSQKNLDKVFKLKNKMQEMRQLLKFFNKT